MVMVHAVLCWRLGPAARQTKANSVYTWKVFGG